MATRYPVSSIVGMRQAMDRLVNDAFNPSQFGTIWPVSGGDKGRSLAPIDAYVTDDDVVILAAIPGVTAGDIEISVEKNTVTLKGEVPSVVKSDHAQGANWYLHELPSGSFHRSLTLPIEVDASKAEATFESGVLRLTLPKAEAARPRQIHVQVGSSQPESPAISEAADQESFETITERWAGDHPSALPCLSTTPSRTVRPAVLPSPADPTDRTQQPPVDNDVDRGYLRLLDALPRWCRRRNSASASRKRGTSWPGCMPTMTAQSTTRKETALTRWQGRFLNAAFEFYSATRFDRVVWTGCGSK